MTRRMLTMLLALLLVFGGVAFWKFLQIKAGMAMGAMPQPPAVIAATQVESMDWQPYLSSVGSLRASQGVQVTNESPGQVAAILFESGQYVDKDTVLLRLDDRVDQAQLGGLVANRKLARVAYDRAARLVKERSVSQAVFDETKAAWESAAAAEQAKRAMLEQKIVRAPFAGLLGIRQVDVGAYLAPGSAIVPLQNVDPVYADFTLPERHISRIAPAQEVRVQVQAYPDEEFTGVISAINPGVDAATRTLRIRATLRNADGRLRAGMFAQVHTVLPLRTGVLTLPRTAVVYNPYGESVFVVIDQDGAQIVKRRQVKTGEVRDGRVEVLEGLQVGERVVSAGQVKLRDGQNIKIDNSVQLSDKVSGG